VELIEKANAEKAQLERDIRAAKEQGASAEDIDKMRLARQKARISVTTFMKHGRVLRAVGEMLMDMQLIDQNPFSICSWSNDDEKRLKSDDGAQKREAWDDRQHVLFGSKIFRDPLEDVGEPLFWGPLLARHQGFRMEEILQLGVDDFGSDNGIPYIRIRNSIVNGLKTLSSARTTPVHPQLIELGLLKLVERRRKEGHMRLFPFLSRGKCKDTFSALFTKRFTYYRKVNDCYWPGLDFHALRTTFHHDLLGDDKSDAIRCRLMGHTYTDEGDRSYGQQLGLRALAERMKSVVVDISMIRNPFGDPPSKGAAIHDGRHLRVVT
jgi:integrase